MKLSEWANTVKMFVFHVLAQQMRTTIEKVLKNHADKITVSVDISKSFLQLFQCLLNGSINILAM